MAIAAEKTLGRLPSFALLIAILAATLGTAVYWISIDVSPILRFTGATGVGIVLTILSEYWVPFVDWRPSRREALQDVLTLVFLNGVVRPLTRGVIIATIVAGTTALNARGVLPDRLDLSSAPLIVQILVLMLLVDFAFYVVHRAEHSVDALWRYHAVHHASTSLYWLKGARLHLVETVYLATVLFCAGAVVRVSPPAFMIASLIPSTMSMLQHSNIAFKLDWLSFIIMPPDIHRVHHSTDAREGQTNYGLLFSIWDRMFGTFHVATPKQLGLGLDEGSPTTFVEDFLFPFRRRPQPTNPEAPAGHVSAGGGE